MSFWNALDAGARSFQGGVNWAYNNVNQLRALRRSADEREQELVVNQLERERALGGSGQPAGEAPQVEGAPQAPTVGQAPAQPPAQTEPATTTVVPSATGGGAAGYAPVAPATPDAAPQGSPATDQDNVTRALQAHNASFYTQGATGERQANPDTVRRIMTGAGLPDASVTVQGIRRASGNADGPIGRGDMNAYFDRARQLFAQRGIGHLYEQWQARSLQTLQSAAQRSLAFAAVAMQGGHPQAAAQWLQRAYGFIPDGANGSVTVGPDGNLVAQRTGADGQPIGQPTTLSAQAIREMAVTMADPGAMETLLLQRQDRAERERHNRAVEGIAASRAASAGRGRTGQETSLTVRELSEANANLDTALESYEAAAAARPRGAPTALSTEQVRGIGRSLTASGVDPAEAARISTAVGLRTARAWQHGQNFGIELGGRRIALPSGTAQLIQHYTAPLGGAPSQPPDGAPATRTAPTHSGTRALRPAPTVAQ